MTFEEEAKKQNLQPFTVAYVKAMAMWNNAFTAGIEEGRRQERKECALIAQSFQIAHCKSHHDDAVNMTATLIKDEILERDAIRAEGE